MSAPLPISRRLLAPGLFAAAALPRPAAAAPADGGLSRLREEFRPLPAFSFLDGQGRSLTVEDFPGQGLLVNLWATWCPPCVAEMPALDRAQAILAAEGVAVLPLSSDRGGAEVVRAFYGRVGIRHLPLLLDPRGAAQRALGVRGLPTTVLIDRSRREVARLEGEAAWDQPPMLAALRRLIGPAGQG
ncbi:MAG: TlpA family protein disulfide reductase [Rhodovarius sp.]|nr:TlpA family protein disulfide reductase [Rhodovarius sp.]